MKKVIYKISSFLLAVIVLASTFSFTINKHYCNGNLKAHNTCNIKKHKCKIYNKKKENICTKIKKENCCKNIIKVINSNKQEQLSIKSLSLKKLHISITFFNSYINLFNSSTINLTPLKDYISYYLSPSLRVLYQTFRI